MSYTYFNISDKLRLYEFEGLLDQYGDATAAYSLRKLRNDYTGSAIRVRRSSDNAERDIGFYDNELDTIALLDWVNTEHNVKTSDFTLGTDGFVATTPANDTLDAPTSIGGEDNAARLTLGGGAAIHSIKLQNILSGRVGQTFNFAFKIYIPSSNVACNGVRILLGSYIDELINTPDQWVSVSLTNVSAAASNDDLFFYARAGASGTVDGDGDTFYIKDVIIDQLTSDGLVQTWYDQSANANHAVQNTDTAQPKIVDAGTLVANGGKPTILYDDVDDVLELTSEVVTTDAFRHFIVCDNDADGRVYDSNGQTDNLLIQSFRYILRVNNTSITINSGTGRDKNIIEAGRDSSDAVDFVVNDSTLSSGTVISGQSKLAQIGSSTSHYGGTIYEVITYNSDATISSLDISGIRGNINTHYSIY